MQFMVAQYSTHALLELPRVRRRLSGECMKLIVLYGPPGVGKLTVAKELASRIGAEIFHNHVVIDVAEPIITRRHPRFSPIVYDLQRRILIAGMEAKAVDVIFTFAFSIDEQEGIDLLSDLVASGEQLGVEVLLVYLNCDRATLYRRLAGESRKEHGKLTDPANLDRLFQRYDLVSPHPHRDQLIVDTTLLAPAEVADRIVSRLAQR
jgi:shikimate kinase